MKKRVERVNEEKKAINTRAILIVIIIIILLIALYLVFKPSVQFSPGVSYDDAASLYDTITRYGQNEEAKNWVCGKTDYYTDRFGNRYTQQDINELKTFLGEQVVSELEREFCGTISEESSPSPTATQSPKYGGSQSGSP